MKYMGYTHIELPVADIPTTVPGDTDHWVLFSDFRYGTPEDFMYFVDECHLAGVE